MCTSVEVLETVSWPAVSNATRGWVRSVFQPVNAGDQLYDASGAHFGPNQGLTCDGWSFSTNTKFGLAVSGDGRFQNPGFVDACDVARPIACCALLP